MIPAEIIHATLPKASASMCKQTPIDCYVFQYLQGYDYGDDDGGYDHVYDHDYAFWVIHQLIVFLLDHRDYDHGHNGCGRHDCRDRDRDGDHDHHGHGHDCAYDCF